MRIVVDHDLCEANAKCVTTAPEVFKLDEKDKLLLLQDAPPEAMRGTVELAAKRCPRGAIKIEG